MRQIMDNDKKNQQRCGICHRIVGVDYKGKKHKCNCTATYRDANRSLRHRDRHGII